MSSCGTGEVITIVVVTLVIFSASRMGQLGNAAGRFVYSFKKAARGDDLIDATPRRIEPPPQDAELVDDEPRTPT
jgi:sec-independent protein translocase protein TatA